MFWRHPKYFLFVLCTAIFIAGVASGLAGIKTPSSPEKAWLDPDTKNQEEVQKRIRLLRDGDLVLRMGNDITSYMLCQMNRQDKSFSHCGLVIFEDGQPFVYHSIGGEDNPDEKVRRDPAAFWFSPKNNTAMAIARFDIDSSSLRRVMEEVQVFYQDERKFDMKFDLNSDDRLYCAELIYKAVGRAMKDSAFIHPSHFLGYTFVGIDNLYLNKRTHIICQIQFK